MATGPDLDDETARRWENVLRWQNEYLDNQSPTPTGIGRICQR